MRIYGFLDDIEKMGLSRCSKLRRSDERHCNDEGLRSFARHLFTCFPQKMLKILFLFLVVLSLAAPLACSSSKSVRKPEQRSASADQSLVTKGPEEVRRKLGEPTTVSRTADGRLYWVYEPSWKLIPNEKGTVYVEFESEKVTKVFKIK